MGVLDGKVAIVTGAGRLRGIGRTTALALADLGADIVITGTGRDPAKFPAAVHAASGIEPRLPEWLGDLMARKERFTVLPSEIKMVEDYLGRHSRAVR